MLNFINHLLKQKEKNICHKIFLFVFYLNLFFACNQIPGEDLATGAGYASPGGSPSESNMGGVIYNLTRIPGEEGSGGGNSNSGVGGKGGGFLNIETFYDLTNYGMYYKNRK